MLRNVEDNPDSKSAMNMIMTEFDAKNKSDSSIESMNSNTLKIIQNIIMLPKIPAEIFENTEDLTFQNESKELETIQIKYLKLRVRHFEKFMSSSFDDVLKSRNEDIMMKEETLRYKTLHEVRLR